ncbi:hypothetical protein Tco_1462198 [Tanacetum coccineum]
MTSQFEAWNEEVLCKNVSLIDAGPSVEEHTTLFIEAQDRLSVEEQTILIMESQDHMKKRPLFNERLDFRPMTSRFESWNGEVLCKNVSLIDAGLSSTVEEQAILVMEAQDRVKKKPLFKMRNSSSDTPFQAHDQPIRSLERGSIVLKCATY